jgi:hypothetical protein
MNTIFADFETYYDKEYSLRKMTPVEYILDPRFEAIGCAVIDGWPSNDQTPRWIEGPHLQTYFNSLDPRVTAFVTHNALFDMCICAWRFGFVPRLMVDTLGVSRACLGHLLRSHSLASVGAHLELGPKGDSIHKAVGMRLADLKANPTFYAQYKAYALNDVVLCRGIYDKLVVSGEFPLEELAVMDMVLRCAVNPKLRLDATVLCEHLAEVQAGKAQALAAAGMQYDEHGGCPDLMSNEKFAGLLRNYGVEPPTKVSKLTSKVTYAFAKTDPGMVALEEHDNPLVQTLVAARVGHKSTLEETRTKRLISISQLQWPGDEPFFPPLRAALMPVPLRFSGAHTHRLSGDWKLNLQNLPRGSKIKRALIAPAGYTIVTADAAQIEARGVASLCGQDDLVEQFERGEDVYASFASEAFGREITKQNDPGARFVGKTSILGLGFQSGWSTLQNALRVQSRSQLGYELKVPDEDAARYVSVYRSKYDQIPKAWRLLNTTGIDVLAHGGGDFKFGPCIFEKGSILLPSGLRLFYHKLERRDNEWWFEYAGKPEKIYGGKLLENIIQALARIITMNAAVRIQKRFELALQVHDELGYVVPDEHVERVKTIVVEEMCKRPDWAPTWPLHAEPGVGKNYGECK